MSLEHYHITILIDMHMNIVNDTHHIISFNETHQNFICPQSIYHIKDRHLSKQICELASPSRVMTHT